MAKGWGAQQEKRYRDAKRGKLSKAEAKQIEREHKAMMGRAWGEKVRAEQRMAKGKDPRSPVKRWGHELRDEARLRTIDTAHQGLFGKLFGGW